jgi:formylglycine-generating enzyme required for sulfatase activity
MAKLNEKLGPGGAKFSLPTEAQWEYACRAGTTTRWSFGDDGAQLGEYAWYRDKMAHPVGQKKPNAWGLYDMHGNVSEWCADWWGNAYYAKSPANDPAGPDSGTYRVLRGGSAGLLIHDFFRCAWRSRLEPDSRPALRIGFRVARTLTP